MAAFHAWRRQTTKDAIYVREAETKNLSAYHRGQREALLDEQRRRMRETREELRAQNRPKWAALYRRQREEWKALNAAQANAYTRLRYHLEQRAQEGPVGDKTGLKRTVRDALRAVFGHDNPHGALSRKHQAERKALAQEIRQETSAVLSNVDKRYRHEMHKLERTQREEAQALRTQHSRASQEAARAIKEGRDLEQFRREMDQPTRQALSEEFQRRAWERIREAKRRRENEKRDKDRDPGREREP